MFHFHHSVSMFVPCLLTGFADFKCYAFPGTEPLTIICHHHHHHHHQSFLFLIHTGCYSALLLAFQSGTTGGIWDCMQCQVSDAVYMYVWQVPEPLQFLSNCRGICFIEMSYTNSEDILIMELANGQDCVNLGQQASGLHTWLYPLSYISREFQSVLYLLWVTLSVVRAY